MNTNDFQKSLSETSQKSLSLGLKLDWTLLPRRVFLLREHALPTAVILLNQGNCQSLEKKRASVCMWDQTFTGWLSRQHYTFPLKAKVNWETECGTNFHILDTFAETSNQMHLWLHSNPSDHDHSYLQTEHNNHCKTKQFFLSDGKTGRLREQAIVIPVCKHLIGWGGLVMLVMYWNKQNSSLIYDNVNLE